MCQAPAFSWDTKGSLPPFNFSYLSVESLFVKKKKKERKRKEKNISLLHITLKSNHFCNREKPNMRMSNNESIDLFQCRHLIASLIIWLQYYILIIWCESIGFLISQRRGQFLQKWALASNYISASYEKHLLITPNFWIGVHIWSLFILLLKCPTISWLVLYKLINPCIICNTISYFQVYRKCIMMLFEEFSLR